ncbi:hypothetical protein QWY85_03780 [Neolewinella lacunae]|uniref:Uncharacterized protein n=1 Tax=Neolewinella lacunae TaxID=1517758 RepID=A0A923PEY1_9BACT|nr:hypothetical protein [Neolewinella lacunae]MBC6992873.1 hypothetical protein [Neolewinella lacunae]MDN3633763.1 hypothetical protein [Neolewinella lacunae]
MRIENAYDMIHSFKNDIFGIIFYLNDGLKRDQIVNLLILLNKFYPSFNFYRGSIQVPSEEAVKVKWEDIILRKFPLEADPYIDLSFNVPVYVQIHDVTEMVFTESGGFNITIEKDERFGYVLIVNIIFNAFFDLNHYPVFNESTFYWEYIETDQAIAAKINRDNLSCFLQELECLVEKEIDVFASSLMIDEVYIYKYGFRDEVISPLNGNIALDNST